MRLNAGNGTAILDTQQNHTALGIGHGDHGSHEIAIGQTTLRVALKFDRKGFALVQERLLFRVHSRSFAVPTPIQFELSRAPCPWSARPGIRRTASSYPLGWPVSRPRAGRRAGPRS